MTLDLKIAGRTSDLGFQVWTAVRLGISSLNSCQTSDPRAHESKIQDPRCSKNFSWIQGRNPGFGSKIQDPRCWKTCAGKPWIHQSQLDPRFLPWIHEKFFKHIKSWSLNPDPRCLPWIQEKKMNILDLGYWILTMSDLRCSSLNWGKNKAWTSDKNSI